MSTVSIAMTTYNGENFIFEQLESLLKQTRLPDEVIICDDKSNDNTTIIIKDFIKKNKLQTKWRLVINEKNKGHNKNFLDCASMTSGDYVFFCDQDDIWHSEKIYKMLASLENNNDIKAISCRTSSIDAEGKPSNSLLNRIRLGNGKLEKISFNSQVKNNMSAGLTLAIERDFFEQVKCLIENNKLPYDLPIGLIAASTGNYYILWEPLVYYRVHSNNVSTPRHTLKSRINNIEFHIKGRMLRIELMRFCEKNLTEIISDIDKRNLRIAIKQLEKDVLSLKERKVMPLILHLFTFNPMINRMIAVSNLACAIFGDYSVYKSEKDQIK